MSRGQVEFVLSKATALARKRREREALDRSFKRIQFKSGKRTWTRADLYDRLNLSLRPEVTR